MLDKVTKETNVGDHKAMEMALTESIVTINEISRHGGFAPVQWVLSRFPRQPATLGDEQERADIGAIQAHLDGPTAFALQAEYRLQARKAFVGWDWESEYSVAYFVTLVQSQAPIKSEILVLIAEDHDLGKLERNGALVPG